MKEKVIFIAKVTVVHVLTYIICVLLAMNIFHYASNMTEIGMRPADSLIVGLAPIFQIIRGVLFGIVLWLFRDAGNFNADTSFQCYNYMVIRQATKDKINPNDCNPRCAMGYDFIIRGQLHQKCMRKTLWIHPIK